jgi:hypothetical protein
MKKAGAQLRERQARQRTSLERRRPRHSHPEGSRNGARDAARRGFQTAAVEVLLGALRTIGSTDLPTPDECSSGFGFCNIVLTIEKMTNQEQHTRRAARRYLNDLLVAVAGFGFSAGKATPEL